MSTRSTVGVPPPSAVALTGSLDHQPSRKANLRLEWERRQGSTERQRQFQEMQGVPATQGKHGPPYRFLIMASFTHPVRGRMTVAPVKRVVAD